MEIDIPCRDGEMAEENITDSRRNVEKRFFFLLFGANWFDELNLAECGDWRGFTFIITFCWCCCCCLRSFCGGWKSCSRVRKYVLGGKFFGTAALDWKLRGTLISAALIGWAEWNDRRSAMWAQTLSSDLGPALGLELLKNLLRTQLKIYGSNRSGEYLTSKYTISAQDILTPTGCNIHFS